MSLKTQLDRLIPALSAKERGVLMLKSLKGELDEDPLWRKTMPVAQYAEFNGYIGLMNAANVHVAHLITFIEMEAEKLDLRVGWLITLHLWQLHVVQIEYGASVVAKEPITETAYRARLDFAANEYLPLAVAAERLVERSRPWSDDDLEDVPFVGEKLVKPEAWSRLCGEAARELGRAAAAGEIEARGRGKALRLRSGSLDAWLGRGPRVSPSWGGGFDVRPDAESAAVERDAATFKRLQDALDRTPLYRMTGGRAGDLGELVEHQEGRLRGLVSLRWRDLRTAEAVVDEIAAEFGGEDPLRPVMREVLDTTRASLLRTNQFLEQFGEPALLPEPTDEDMEEARAFVQRGRRLFA